MRTIKIILAGALLVTAGTAFGQTLEELAQRVQQAAREEGQINAEREAEFQRQRNNQSQRAQCGGKRPRPPRRGHPENHRGNRQGQCSRPCPSKPQ